MSLIICKYASSIHVACLKIPHFKEPTQQSSVQICTPGPGKECRDETQRPVLVGDLLMSLIIRQNLSFSRKAFGPCVCVAEGKVAEDEFLCD